jgi:hypothetical protein
MADRENAHLVSVENLNQTHSEEIQSKITQYQALDTKNSNESTATSKKYRDDLEKMHTENNSYLSKLNVSHSTELKNLDTDKTKRERDHL